MSNFFDKDTQSEYEQISETFEDQAQALLDEMDEDEEEYEDEEEIEEETMKTSKPSPNKKAAYNLNNRESSILNDATVRLEQARLYDMLIKHNLFAGVKAHPRALENVQNELKSYIVNRLEILLGIKQEKKEQTQPKQLVVDSPFNDVEIEFLKALSYKGTKGASAQAPSKRMIANEIQPLGQPSQNQNTLRPMVQEEEEELSSFQEEVEEDDYEEEYVEPPKSSKPKQKIKKKPRPQAQTRGGTQGVKRLRRGELSDAEAEAIAMEDLKKNGRGLTKHPYEMSEKELRALAKKGTKKNVRPAGALEMPTSDQSAMYHHQIQSQQSMNPQNDGFNTILQKVLADKNK